MAEPAWYKQAAEAQRTGQSELDRIVRELADAYRRWEALEDGG